MNLLLFAGIIVIVLVLFEMFKHVMFKSFARTILMVLLVVIVFFMIIATLESENSIETDNPIIQTGAAIVDSIKDQGVTEGFSDKLSDIKESISDAFS